jgi:hypothetical protein
MEREPMGELVLVLIVAAVVVLLAWPAMRATRRRRAPTDQPTMTDRRVTPPRRPDRPVPGSQPDRERKGQL